MEKSLTQLVEEMAQLRRQEQTILARAAKLDYGIQVLKTKKWKILQQAKMVENKRHDIARIYHAQKSPCRNLLTEAEKAIGRRLTLDEIQRIEIFYAKKTGKENSSCVTQ